MNYATTPLVPHRPDCFRNAAGCGRCAWLVAHLRIPAAFRHARV